MANEQNLIPFTKGDERINRKGRPKNFDAIRELFKEIMDENEDIRKNGEIMSRFEAIARDWINSRNFQKQLAAMQYAYGKVPDKLEVNQEGNRIIVEWTDGEYEAPNSHELGVHLERVEPAQDKAWEVESDTEEEEETEGDPQFPRIGGTPDPRNELGQCAP